MVTHIQPIVDAAAKTSRNNRNQALMRSLRGGLKTTDTDDSDILDTLSGQSNVRALGGPDATASFASSPAKGLTRVPPSKGTKLQGGSGGSIQMGGRTMAVGGADASKFTGFEGPGGNAAYGAVSTPAPPPSTPSTAPVPTPTTVAAPQTEAANPLSGDTNSAPTGAVQTLPGTGPTRSAQQMNSPNPGAAMGYSSRGMMTPRGTDVVPGGGFTGGQGPYARSFSNPTSGNIYDTYTRKLFSSPAPSLQSPFQRATP